MIHEPLQRPSPEPSRGPVAQRAPGAPGAASVPPTAVSARSGAAVARDASPERSDALAGLLARAVAQRGRQAAAAPQAPSSHPVLARTPIDNAGATFNFDEYRIEDPDNGANTARSIALNVKITYKPASALRSKKIGFVQVLKSLKGGALYHLGVGKHRATGADSGDAGWELDRTQGVISPIYGQADDGGTLGNTGFGSQSWWWCTSAWMTDRVSRNRAVGQTIKIDFVTYAFDETNSTYLGGVSWGFAVDAAGNTTAKKPALHEAGAPTGVQKQALQRWNEQADLADVDKRNAPGQVKVVVP